VVGYSTIKSLAEGMKKARSTETEKLVKAFSGLELMTPFGKITYRAIDNQSTMGAYVGKTANRNGAGTMVDYKYLDGAKYLPSDDEVRKLRPAQ
ncbi:MAG: ABC transporter substrate-binding protein, partial [Comamonadaceae bacterium]